jgi:aldehyde dehydrogenase (NAD+)
MNTTAVSVRDEALDLLTRLGVPESAFAEGSLVARTPITGEVLARIPTTSAEDARSALSAAHDAFQQWRTVPAPRRGELVRLLGEELRTHLEPLGRLVTLEAGKILSEGHGEVQEMIDICTFAAGLSRQLAGLTLPSERPHHRMLETWHPLGVTGIISAFNFPVAVWSWNAALALVCGNSIVWKPSEKTPLTALATHAIFERARQRFNKDAGRELAPANLSTLLMGDATPGEILVDSPLVPVVSATGSTAMGRAVAPKLAQRFARAILELGGNNAAIVCPSADLDLALRGIAFAAMGTAGQRCTTLRRLIVHESIYDQLLPRLKHVYTSVSIGDPRGPHTLVGPLIDARAFDAMQKGLTAARNEGATITGGERVSVKNLDNADAFYARPALVEVARQTDIVKQETFAPILYVLKYRTLDEALALHNDVPQGLSSSIFTLNVREAEQFLASSDCGIANVNIGTSGAEIGGAFGGEKDTGGGRESGSDAWKQYMRRATNTINYGTDLPLAQGVSFEIS